VKSLRTLLSGEEPEADSGQKKKRQAWTVN
jgi:hypothetical protein